MKRLQWTKILCGAGALSIAGWAGAAPTGIDGTGTFKPPTVNSPLPVESPFSAADLASGRLTFSIRWDDTAADRDPTTYIGSYAAAISRFTVRIGATEIELPVATSLIEVSDGGNGIVNRESIKLHSRQRYGPWQLAAGWMTMFEAAQTVDLRGAPGSLQSDALPDGTTLTGFNTSGPFDRSFFLTLQALDSQARFPIYLQTSSVQIKAAASAAR